MLQENKVIFLIIPYGIKVTSRAMLVPRIGAIATTTTSRAMLIPRGGK